MKNRLAFGQVGKLFGFVLVTGDRNQCLRTGKPFLRFASLGALHHLKPQAILMSLSMDPHLQRDAIEVIFRLDKLNARFAGKRVLLTGAAGFLGAHFVHYFLCLNDSKTQAACHLTAVDNYSRGIPAWLIGLEGRSDIKLQKADIVREQTFEPVDFIIHAASIASPTYYRRFPIETMDANVQGLRNLLEHARKSRPEGFLFFSTSEIYGDPDPSHIPTSETYRGNVSCTGPRACYDESKRYGETLCVNFTATYHLPCTVARPFNNYGPGLQITDRRVLPDFFRDVLQGKDIVMLSDGRATRTFCYVSDAINGYLRVLLRGRPGEAYNIGATSPEISMRELALLVVKTARAPVSVTVAQSDDREYLTDNPQRRCPIIEKAITELGFHPQIELGIGLERMLAYYRDAISNSAGPAGESTLN